MNRTGSNPFFQRNLFIYISNIHSFDLFFAQKKGYKIDICARKLCIYIRIYLCRRVTRIERERERERKTERERRERKQE